MGNEDAEQQVLPGFLQTLFGDSSSTGLGADLLSGAASAPGALELSPQAQRDLLLAMQNSNLQAPSTSMPGVAQVHVPTGAPAAVAQGSPVAAAMPGKPIPSSGDDKAALNQMIESRRPDLGLEGDAMRGLLRPGFSRDLFDNYWQGSGQPVQLSDARFRNIADYASTLQPMKVTHVSGPNGQALEAHLYDLYGSPDYARSLGRSTLFYDEAGKPVGFYDNYDFDPAPFGQKRKFLPEMETRAMNVLGSMHGAQDFPIYYGKYVPPKG